MKYQEFLNRIFLQLQDRGSCKNFAFGFIKGHLLEQRHLSGQLITHVFIMELYNYPYPALVKIPLKIPRIWILIWISPEVEYFLLSDSQKNFIRFH